MMAVTTYFRDLLMNHIVFGEPFPAITYHLGLLYNLTEVTDASYSRQPVAWVDDNGIWKNLNVKAFGAATSTYQFNQAGLYDAASGGNLLIYNSVGQKSVAAGSKPVCPANNLWFYPN